MVPDPSTTAEFNRRWAAIVVEFCIRHGMDHFFVAPGSRCTPLTVAIANHPQAHAVRHFDERGLAFACQGFGRATNRPGVFVCTSGTAVANAFPAVIEASMENVPMLLLTADRPPELHGIGANQTIDQQEIFGRFARVFVNADCYDGDETQAMRILHQAICSDREPGPIQINCMFREPFGTSDDPIDVSHLNFAEPVRDAPPKGPSEPIQLPQGETLFVLGRCRPHEANAAIELAQRMNVPLLADISSGVREIAYDLALVRGDLPKPKNVVHLGGRFVSKRLLMFLEKCSLENFWHVSPFKETTIDPLRKVSRFIESDIARFCQNAEFDSSGSGAHGLLNGWREAGCDSLRIAKQVIDATDEISEPRLACDVAELIPEHHGLFLGNSMPIRDMDVFGFWPHERSIAVAVNRGASGIDGLMASAVGFARGLQQPMTVIVGDLSALHDLNSFDLIRRSEQPITVIVINNDGGGIFHFLPVAQQTARFESYFGTPHGLSFEHAAAQFQLPYSLCQTTSDFRDHYADCVGKRSSVLEVNTDRKMNRQLHVQINRAIKAAI